MFVSVLWISLITALGVSSVFATNNTMEFTNCLCYGYDEDHLNILRDYNPHSKEQIKADFFDVQKNQLHFFLM